MLLTPTATGLKMIRSNRSNHPLKLKPVNVRPSRKANQLKSVILRRMTAHAAEITGKIVSHGSAENVVDADEMTDRAETGPPVIALAVTDLLMKAGATAMIAATEGAVHRSRRSQIY